MSSSSRIDYKNKSSFDIVSSPVKQCNKLRQKTPSMEEPESRTIEMTNIYQLMNGLDYACFEPFKC